MYNATNMTSSVKDFYFHESKQCYYWIGFVYKSQQKIGDSHKMNVKCCYIEFPHESRVVWFVYIMDILQIITEVYSLFMVCYVVSVVVHRQVK